MATPDRIDPATGPEKRTGEGMREYNIVADKVGLVPNVRLKDNLIQGLVVLIFTIIGALVGIAIGRDLGGLLLGAGGGMFAGFLLSGLVLMVVGLVRKS